MIAVAAGLPFSLAQSVPSTATTVAGSPVIEVLAAPSTSGTVAEGQALSVRVTLSNTSTQSTGPLRVELRLDGARAASRDELATWFTDVDPQVGPALGDDAVATRASVGPLAPGDSAVLDLVVPARSALWGGAFGARLVEVAIGDAEAVTWLAVDRTAVVRVPTGAASPSVGMTFVQPLTTPGEPGAFLSADALAAATAESGALTRALAASAGRPVLLAIDPRVIASIRLLGDDAPESALAFLDRLAAAPNESMYLPWADADPLAPVVAAGVTTPQPEGTGRLLLGGEEGAGETPAPTGEPSDDPDAELDGEGVATAQIAELLDFAPTFDDTLWPGRSGFSAAALDAVTAEGARVVLTPSSALDSAGALQQYGDAVLLRADDTLADAANDAVHAPSQQQFERAMARVSALFASTAAASPGSPVIIALDRDTPRGVDRLLDTLAQSISLPWTTASTLSAALAGPATAAEVIDTDTDELRVGAVAAALEAEAADRQFAQIALAPALITDTRRLELLAALSLGWGDGSIEALRGFIIESQALRASVQVVESAPILLLADRSTIPVTVQNDLDVAVRVFVRVEPDTAQLRVLDGAVETVVEPQSQSRTLVPVESLTNGDVDITVTVRDAQNRVLSDATRVSLSLQAGWETAGVIIVAIAVALLFIVGIARDLRKRSRRATGHAEPDGDAGPAAEGDPS